METFDQSKVLLPLLLIGGGSLVLLLADALLRGSWSRGYFVVLVILGALAAQIWVGAPLFTPGATVTSDTAGAAQTLFGGFFVLDGLGFGLSLLVLGGALLSMLVGLGSLGVSGIGRPTEYYALMLFAVFGALVLVTAGEFITLFVGLEILSMSLYCLAGSQYRIRRSGEAALKYFVLGAFSSALLLYGIALTYGATGTTVLSEVATALETTSSALVPLALGFIFVGLVFKIGAVPFHFWCPDVYQGSPTPVTVFMASAVKAAAIGVALRVLWGAFASVEWLWVGLLWVTAVLTMTVANLIALRQRSVKRLLAYSSIAHAGYMLVAFLAHSGPPQSPLAGDAGASILFYLVAYTLMTVGSFGVVHLIERSRSQDIEADSLESFRGLGARRPVLAAVMALFLLSLAGLPPGMAGLLGKFYLFSAAIRADYVGIAVLGLLNSAIACFYYLRVIVVMYFEKIETAETWESAKVPFPLGAALTVSAVGVVLLGVFPGPLFRYALQLMNGI